MDLGSAVMVLGMLVVGLALAGVAIVAPVLMVRALNDIRGGREGAHRNGGVRNGRRGRGGGAAAKE